MKRLLFALLTIHCSLFTVYGADYGADYTGPFTYTIANGEATITGVTGGKSSLPEGTHLIIPETVTDSDDTYPVTTIGNVAFDSCIGLTSVTIPNSVTTIGANAFQDCTGLTSVTIPNSVTAIGGYVFRHCTGLTSVTIPNSVTTIGTSAFEGCYDLTFITIGNAVTTIGKYAFRYCAKLTHINSMNPIPPTLGPLFFENVSAANINLYVLIGSKAAYSQAAGWKDFAHIIETDFATEEPTPQDYTIIFDSNGGTHAPNQIVTEGHLVVKPTPNPTREGYVFDGWHFSAGRDDPYDFYTPVTANIHLYAHWITDEPEPDNGEGNASSTINYSPFTIHSYYDLSGRKVSHPETGRLYLIIYSSGERQLIINH